MDRCQKVLLAAISVTVIGVGLNGWLAYKATVQIRAERSERNEAESHINDEHAKIVDVLQELTDQMSSHIERDDSERARLLDLLQTLETMVQE